MPLRWWPVAQSSPGERGAARRAPARCRASRGAGRRAAPRPRARARPGTSSLRVAQQLVAAPSAVTRRVEAALLDRRAEHVAPVAARARGSRPRSARRACSSGARGSCARSRRRRIWPFTGRTGTRAAGGHARRARRDHGPAATTTCPAATRSPPASATPLTRTVPDESARATSTSGRSVAPARSAAAASAAHERARVDGVVARAPRARRAGPAPARARSARACEGSSDSRLQAEALAQRELALERLGLVAVAGHEQRARRRGSRRRCR